MLCVLLLLRHELVIKMCATVILQKCGVCCEIHSTFNRFSQFIFLSYCNAFQRVACEKSATFSMLRPKMLILHSCRICDVVLVSLASVVTILWMNIYFYGVLHMAYLVCRKENVSHSQSVLASSNRNIFRITGPWWGEFTGHRWIRLTKASDTELWWVFLSAPKQMVE